VGNKRAASYSAIGLWEEAHAQGKRQASRVTRRKPAFTLKSSVKGAGDTQFRLSLLIVLAYITIKAPTKAIASTLKLAIPTPLASEVDPVDDDDDDAVAVPVPVPVPDPAELFTEDDIIDVAFADMDGSVVDKEAFPVAVAVGGNV